MTTCIQSINNRTTYNTTTNTLINAAQKLLEVRKGDLIFVDFDKMINTNNGLSFQMGKRPCVVLSNDIGNKYSPTIWVATLTSKLNKNNIPTHVKVTEEMGLRYDSLVLVEQTYTIDKKMVISKVGKCPDYIMEQIDMAVKIQAGTIDIDYITDTVNWINKVETEAFEFGFDPEDARLHARLVKELQSYCNQYGYDYNKLLNEKLFIKGYEEHKNQKII